MQREIKYRGKRLDNGEWVYGCPVKDWSGNTYIITEFGCRVTTCSDCGMPIATYYEVITETVGQYTGLKDKNSKEIYEGDIIETILEEYDNLSEKAYVAWCNDGYWGVYANPNHLFGMLRSYACGEYEVIGNIYENPELLQEVE